MILSNFGSTFGETALLQFKIALFRFRKLSQWADPPFKAYPVRLQNKFCFATTLAIDSLHREPLQFHLGAQSTPCTGPTLRNCGDGLFTLSRTTLSFNQQQLQFVCNDPFCTAINQPLLGHTSSPLVFSSEQGDQKHFCFRKYILVHIVDALLQPYYRRWREFIKTRQVLAHLKYLLPVLKAFCTQHNAQRQWIASAFQCCTPELWAFYNKTEAKCFQQELHQLPLSFWALET